jgi:hypothetical protein
VQSPLSPIGEHMPSVVASIPTHPNIRAMHDAVDRWIARAKDMPTDEALRYLRNGIRQIDENFDTLCSHVQHDTVLPAFLEGIQPGDYEAARSRLLARVDRLTAAMWVAA